MKEQHKATLVGFILGIVVGLFLALSVAVYVTKVPVPFLNKSHTRSADQDAAETKKNRNWNPNAPLQSKSEPRTSTPSASVSTTPAPLKPLSRPAVTGDPLGDLAKARAAGADPYAYVLQVGAFSKPEDAEAQRAKLSLSGIEAQVSERERSGETLYRVRVGPITSRDEAAAVKSQLESAGYETSLLRMQR